MKTIVIYQPVVDSVNGTNTSMINFLKTFCDEYNIIVVCDSGSFDIIYEFSKYADVYMIIEEEIECDYLIFNRYDVREDTLKRIKCKTKPKMMIHCDFDYLSKKGVEFLPIPKIDADYICVSDIAAKGLKKVFKKNSIVIPNIVTKPKQQKWLRLISATRCSEDKGFPEMCEFARILKENDIPYMWDVYTNTVIDNSEELFYVKKPRLDINEIICNYDYMVIFSKNDTFSYNIHESLISGIPVLCTPFEATDGVVKDGKNGYILPFDMKLSKNILNKIVNKKPSDFNYKGTNGAELWKKVLK